MECPGCGKDIEDSVKVCPECGVEIESFKTDSDKGNGKSPVEDSERGPEELDEGETHRDLDDLTGGDTTDLNQDDLDLLMELKEKINGAKTVLEEDLDDEFDSMEKRVTEVVDSIDRIESMDSPRPDDILYKDTGESEEEEPPSPEKEVESEKEMGGLPEKYGNEADYEKDTEDQLAITGESPYFEMKRILESTTTDIMEEATYSVNVEELVSSMIKLSEIKMEKGKTEDAVELLQMSYAMNPEEEIREKLDSLGVKYRDDTSSEEQEITPVEKTEETRDKTRVLAPELEAEISSLEKKASSSLNQAERLMKSNPVPRDRFDDLSNRIMDSRKLFNEKRFHRSHEISLGIISELREMIRENLDQQTQGNIDRSREMLENIKTGDFDIPEEILEKINSDFDKAVKSYLTDDFEKANLLSKKVISKILEFSEPEGVELRKEISRIKEELRDVSDSTLLENPIDELKNLLETAEDLIEKRDYKGAERVVNRSKENLNDIKTRKQLYFTAKEIQIKLNNKIERFEEIDSDISDIKKKLDYLNKMFDEERYEDVITLGGDIETSIEGLEMSRKEKEAKKIKDELSKIMVYVEEMDSPSVIKERYNSIQTRYDSGDIDHFLKEGDKLLRELKNRMKTLSMTRGRRIASGIIDARMYISKLRSMNVDTIEFERRTRKAKNLIKEDNFIEGIRQLDRVNTEMHDRISEDTKYLKDYVDIHRDALSAILDRYRNEPSAYIIRKRKIPLLRKLSDLGKYRKALEMYRGLESSFSDILTKHNVRSEVETQLTECKFELYKRKDQGYDITEPLNLYTQAQDRLGNEKIISAEYLIEISRRYCDVFLSST